MLCSKLHMRAVLAIALFICAVPSFAWDATGHRLVAAIAYDRLTPQTRARVDELLSHHPDYERLARGAPDDPVARARAVFIAAATWPDTIKGDPRFWDDTRPNGRPTDPLPGFPDMKRHTNWHYYDTPYTPDGAHAPKQPAPNALSELPRLIREVSKAPAQLAAYDLVWIEHIEGDLHQPLHCVSRFLLAEPGGDAGGNAVIVGPRRNLHSLWDQSAGTEVTDAYISKYAAEAVAAHPAPGKIEKNPKKWIREGFVLAKTEVYTFGNETGSREHPLHLPAGYTENARRVAQTQIATGGYRLAAVLNDKLK